MSTLKGDPVEGEAVLLEVTDTESLPLTVKSYLIINPQVVRYWGREREGVWFQIPESTLKGQTLPTGEARDWGPFSFFLKWEQIGTIVRLENQPSSGGEPMGFKPTIHVMSDSSVNALPDAQKGD
jgi:hypothetical protein